MDHLGFMRMAVDEAKKAPGTAEPKVGVVIARDEQLVAYGHKNEDGSSFHAEVVALAKAALIGADLEGATAYVTLEPCTNLHSSSRLGCADRLADAGISTIYIGRYDRNPRINRLGWRRLRDRGILCLDFTEDLRDELDTLTATFSGYFLRRDGYSGIAKFDFMQNGGKYDLATTSEPGALIWATQWTTRGAESIYAYGGSPGHVALARYAVTFDEIDDPGAYDFSGTSADLELGMIAIYRNEHGYALVQLLDIEPPPPYGATPHVSVKIAYVLRPKGISGSSLSGV